MAEVGGVGRRHLIVTEKRSLDIKQVPANPMSPQTPLEEDVSTFLSSLKLGQYCDKFEAEGYDDMEVIRCLTPGQFDSMANAIQMKQGHRIKLRNALDGKNGSTQIPLTPTAPANRQSFTTTPRNSTDSSPSSRGTTPTTRRGVADRSVERVVDDDGPSDDRETPRGNWKKGEVIGRGAFGQVFKGLWNGRGQVIAIKELYFDKKQQKQLLLLRKEIEMLRKMQHENIVTYLGGEEQFDGDSSKLYIFCEWVAGGSVQGMLDRYGNFDEAMCKRYAAGALNGLRYLHEYLGTPVIHRDIKPANVLITPNGIAKLADFGAAHFLENSLGETSGGGSSLAGTPYFMAPETIDQRNVGRRSDVWSFGGFVLNMATGRPPWKPLELRSPWALFERVRTSEETPLDVELQHSTNAKLGGETICSELSQDLIAFLRRCFTRDYQRRPYAKDISDDPWLEAPEDLPCSRGNDDTLSGIKEYIGSLHRSESEDHSPMSDDYRRSNLRVFDKESSPSQSRPTSGPEAAVRSSPLRNATRGAAALRRRASKANDASPTTSAPTSIDSVTHHSPSNQTVGVSPNAPSNSKAHTSSSNSNPPARNPFRSRQRSIPAESQLRAVESVTTPPMVTESQKSVSVIVRESSHEEVESNTAANILRRASVGDNGGKANAFRASNSGRKIRLQLGDEDTQHRLLQKVKKNLSSVSGTSQNNSSKLPTPTPKPMIGLEEVRGTRDLGTSLQANSDRQNELCADKLVDSRQEYNAGYHRTVTVVQTIDLDAERFRNSQRDPGIWNKESLAKATRGIDDL